MIPMAMQRVWHLLLCALILLVFVGMVHAIRAVKAEKACVFALYN